LAFCPLAQEVNQGGLFSRRIKESVPGMHGGSGTGEPVQ
jgi:hypothetical protein